MGTTVTRLVLNDRQGLVSNAFAKEGETVYAYHPSHTEEVDATFSPDWKTGGIVFKYGEPFDVLVKSMLRSIGSRLDHITRVDTSSYGGNVFLSHIRMLGEVGLMTPATQLEIKLPGNK